MRTIGSGRILLTGSAARGSADRYSDLDLGVVVKDGTAAAIVELCATVTGPLAHSATLERGPVVIFSALTTEALRVDVLVEPVSVATRRRQPPHRVLTDHDGIAERLQALAGAPAQPGPLVAEFLRVLALLEIVIGREEYFVGAQGVMLLRDHLVDLFYIENERTRTSGRKRLNDELTAEQRELLASQPPLLAERTAVIEGHRAAAKAFLPRARVMLHARNEPWPETLTTVVKRQLQGLIDPSVLAQR